MTEATGQLQTGPSDGDLLAGFLHHCQQESFAQLVRRHGGMVLGVCGSVLHNPADAEDAAQAVFLTLAQRAASLKGQTTLIGWLHRVAWYVATRAAEAAAIRRRHEQEAARMKKEAIAVDENLSLDLIHAELNRLPDKYRLPLLLHHIDGRTQEETASLLGCTVSAASVRLTRGRQILRDRLLRHGVAASAGGLASAMASQASAAVTLSFVSSTSQAAVCLLAGKAAVAAPASVVTLSKGALHMLFWTKMKLAAMVTAVVFLVGGAGVATFVVAANSSTAPASQPAAPTADVPTLDVKDLICLRVENGRFAGSWAAKKSPSDTGAFRTSDPPLNWLATDKEGTHLGDFRIDGSNPEQKSEAGVWMCTARAWGDYLWLRAHYGIKNSTCAIEMMVTKDQIRLIGTTWGQAGDIVRDIDLTAPDLKQLVAKDPKKVGKYLTTLLAVFTTTDLLATATTQPAADKSPVVLQIERTRNEGTAESVVGGERQAFGNYVRIVRVIKNEGPDKDLAADKEVMIYHKGKDDVPIGKFTVHLRAKLNELGPCDYWLDSIARDGLSVVVEPAKPCFKTGETLALKLNYRNLSKDALRLPDQPDLCNYWQLNVEDVATGKTYTGRTRLPMGDIGPNKPTAAIQPGDALAVEVKLDSFQLGFADGQWDPADMKWDMGKCHALPVGKYKATIDLCMPAYAKHRLYDRMNPPIWAGAMVSEPFVFEVSDKPTAQSVEKNGLSIAIEPAKAIFKTDEPLAFTVTLRNVSDKDFTLLHDPYTADDWTLTISAATGEQYRVQRVKARMRQAVGEPLVLKSHDEHSFKWTLDDFFGYALENVARKNVTVLHLPPGKYTLTASTTMEGVTKNVEIAKLPPLWVGEIVSGPAAFEISEAAAPGINQTDPGKTSQAAAPATQPAVSSKPVEKDGLQVMVMLPQASIAANDSLAFTVQFKNVSDKPFNLLNADGYHYRDWTIRFKKQGEGSWKEFGFDEAGELKLSVVQVEPGRVLTVPVVLEGRDLTSVARILTDGYQQQLRMSDGKQHPLKPGKYLLAVKMDLRDNVENDPTPAVRYWAGPILTKPVEFEITDKPAATEPSKLAGERAAKLKTDLKTFTLRLDYHGAEDKPYYRLLLSVPVIKVAKDDSPFNQLTQITQEQAAKIVDHLATEGFLENALDGNRDRSPAEPTGPHYTLTVWVENGGDPVLYEQWLTWDAKMLSRFDAIRAVLDGQAGKQMDLLIGRLAGLRKE